MLLAFRQQVLMHLWALACAQVAELRGVEAIFEVTIKGLKVSSLCARAPLLCVRARFRRCSLLFLCVCM